MTDVEKNAKEQLNESLSALVDGEVSELELRRILKSDTDEVNALWRRYNLASSAIKGELGQHAQTDLSASISAAIADEPELSVASPDTVANNQTKTKVSRLWPNLGRLGIAASVAGAVVVGVQFTTLNSTVNIAEVPATATQPAPATGAPALGGDTTARVVSQQGEQQSNQQTPIVLNEATRQQLQQMEEEVNRLMLEHQQNASQNTQQGVLPYIRVPDAEQ